MADVKILLVHENGETKAIGLLWDGAPEWATIAEILIKHSCTGEDVMMDRGRAAVYRNILWAKRERER